MPVVDLDEDAFRLLQQILPPPPVPGPVHFLEVTVISAQDLHPAIKSSMHTYAIAWTDPSSKHQTATDVSHHTDPVWNQKLLFHLDDQTLRSDTASINFDIFAVRSRLRPGSDTLLGTARALLSTLQPTMSVKFMALQVRRPSSLRPQGILNIGVKLVDAYAKSMPLRGPETATKGMKAILARSPSVKEMEKKLEMWRGELPRAKEKAAPRDATEKKLEKWRMELPTVKDETEKERVVRFGRGFSRRTKSGKIPWFGNGSEGKEGGGEDMQERS